MSSSRFLYRHDSSPADLVSGEFTNWICVNNNNNNDNNKCYLARVISSAENAAINEGPG